MAASLECVDYLNQFPLDGIALLGSTGGFVHFDIADRQKLAQMCVKRSHKPLIVNASHSTLDGTVSLAESAMDAGAAAVLVMPPYFFRYDQAAIREFFFALANELGSNVPVYLYNIPFFTSPLEAETAFDLLSSGRFAGIKDSSGQFDFFRRVTELPNRESVTLVVGNDAMYLRGVELGADGLISGIASMSPELMLALSRAARAKDATEIERLKGLLQECFGWLDQFPVPAAIQLACGWRGVRAGDLAVPLSPAQSEKLGAFRDWFSQLAARVGATN